MDEDEDLCLCGGELVADEDRPGGVVCMSCNDKY